MNFIPQFLGKILYFIYNNFAFESYGLAIILFTIFIKSVLLPLTVKQYKSSEKMQELQPLMKEIQRKYKNDREKQNQELAKLFQEHKHSPASGCLPLLVQMPILFSLIYVIGKPLNYLFAYDGEKIKELVTQYYDHFKELAVKPPIDGFYEQIGAVDYLGLLNLKFLGFNLGLVPRWNPNDLFGPESSTYLPLIIFPILAIITTYLSTKISMARTNQMAQSGENGNDMSMAVQKNMLFLAPVMTFIVSFQFPAGLALYWIVGNVFQIFQQLFLNKYILKKKEVKIQ